MVLTLAVTINGISKGAEGVGCSSRRHPLSAWFSVPDRQVDKIVLSLPQESASDIGKVTEPLAPTDREERWTTRSQ